MKYKPEIILVLLSIIGLLGIYSCQSDKFLGYSYEAENFIELSQISGKITDLFTGDVVVEARVRIGDNIDSTKSDGNYQINYILTADDQLNRPVQIEIVAENYHPLLTSRIVFPEPLEFNFSLEYGAPIIEDAAFYRKSTCQAIIWDYQGTSDIVSVEGRFLYLNPDSGHAVAQVLDTTLRLVRSVSENRAHYQVIVDSLKVISSGVDGRGQPDTLVIGTVYQIRATDRRGFTDFESYGYNGDSLLFIPTADDVP